MAIIKHKKTITGTNNPDKQVSKDAWEEEHAVSEINNADIAADAAIAESKLALDYPTHDNAPVICTPEMPTPWDDVTDYVIGNFVTDSGVPYICVQDNQNISPASDPAYWTEVEYNQRYFALEENNRRVHILENTDPKPIAIFLPQFHGQKDYTFQIRDGGFPLPIFYANWLAYQHSAGASRYQFTIDPFESNDSQYYRWVSVYSTGDSAYVLVGCHDKSEVYSSKHELDDTEYGSLGSLLGGDSDDVGLHYHHVRRDDFVDHGVVSGDVEIPFAGDKWRSHYYAIADDTNFTADSFDVGYNTKFVTLFLDAGGLTAEHNLTWDARFFGGNLFPLPATFKGDGVQNIRMFLTFRVFGPVLFLENVLYTSEIPQRYTLSSEQYAALINAPFIDIIAGDTEPEPPPDGKVRLYFKSTGTTPNNRQILGLKFPTGDPWIFADRTI